MNDPLEQLSDDDLHKLSSGDLEGMSTEALQVVSSMQAPPKKTEEAPPQQNPNDKRGPLEKQIFKGLYKTVPFGKRLVDTFAPEDAAMIRNAPEAKGLGEKIASATGMGVGALAGFSPAASGVSGLAKLLGAGKVLAPTLGLVGGGGIQGGGTAAANNQNVVEGTLKGAAGSLLGAGASKIGAQLIPKFIPGAEKIGSALGFGAVGAASPGSMEDRLANAITGVGMGVAMPMSRKADYTDVRRQEMMNQTIDSTMKSLGIKPRITKNMSTKTYNDSQDKLKTSMLDIWKTYRGAFSGKDNTPANVQEIVGASDMAMTKAKQDMVDAMNKSVFETQVTPMVQKPVMEQRNIWNKDKGAYAQQTLPKIGKDGQPVMRSIAQEPQTKMVQTFFLDGNKVGRQLAGVLTSNKKILEVAGEYDLKAIQKRVQALRNKTISIDEVPKILAELNQSYGKDSKIANINKELAGIIRNETEMELNRVDQTMKGTAGKDFRDARRRWGAAIELHDRLLRLANKQQDMPEGNMASKIGQGIGAVQAGLGVVGHNPVRTALGGAEMLVNKYGNNKISKDPVQAFGEMFKKLDKQENLRTLNQQITEMARRKPMENLRNQPQPSLKAPVMAAGLSAVAMGAGNAMAAPPPDEDAIKAILGEVGPGGLDAMREVASVIRNRNKGLKGIYGQNNPNVINKKYTPKQEADARQAWAESKNKKFNNAYNWFSNADLNTDKVKNIIKKDKLRFIKKKGGNSFYEKNGKR